MFLRHEPCPRCGPIQDRAGDNVGVYADGHKWCFACGYYVSSSGIPNLSDIRLRLKKEKEEKEHGVSLNLPNDHTHILPIQALNWLRQYQITDEEINKYKIGWSETYNRLIFPVFDGAGKVLMWQGRYFGSIGTLDVNRSKYFTQGKPEEILSLFGHAEASTHLVCMVEDFISAIKVARVCPSMCLWGSEISIKRLRRTALQYDSLVIWLDKDKAGYSARCEVKARPYFTMVSGLYTESDPKTFSTEVIRKYIWT